MGVNNDPLYYVIRSDHPAGGWVPPTAFVQEAYQLSHTGSVYNRYKKIVWVKILKASLNNPSLEWINYFYAMEDSRSAWQFLVDKCEVQDSNNKRVLLATRFVSLSPNGGGRGVFYSNEHQFSFNNYINNMQEM